MRDPATDPEANEGLKRKWEVRRIGDTDTRRKHGYCRTFVLDFDHDRFAMPAIDAYIQACEAEYPRLAKDLRLEVYGSD